MRSDTVRKDRAPTTTTNPPGHWQTLGGRLQQGVEGIDVVLGLVEGVAVARRTLSRLARSERVILSLVRSNSMSG
jgi:hypothetical protein